MTTCPNCGTDVRDDAAACDVCGHDLAGTAGGSRAATGQDAGATPSPPPPPGAPGAPAAPGAWSGPTGPPAAHPSGLPSDVRNWGMAAHLSSFVGVFVGGVAAFVGPLAIWLLKREEHPFIEHHAKEALNFNLSILLYGVVSGLLVLVLVGIPLLVAVVVVYVVFTIIAAVKAANGEGYRYPLTIRFVK